MIREQVAATEEATVATTGSHPPAPFDFYVLIGSRGNSGGLKDIHLAREASIQAEKRTIFAGWKPLDQGYHGSDG